MTELYEFIVQGAVTDFDKILHVVFFMIIFQGILYLMMELIRIGKGRR